MQNWFYFGFWRLWWRYSRHSPKMDSILTGAPLTIHSLLHQMKFVSVCTRLKAPFPHQHNLTSSMMTLLIIIHSGESSQAMRNIEIWRQDNNLGRPNPQYKYHYDWFKSQYGQESLWLHAHKYRIFAPFMSAKTCVRIFEILK